MNLKKKILLRWVNVKVQFQMVVVRMKKKTQLLWNKKICWYIHLPGKKNSIRESWKTLSGSTGIWHVLFSETLHHKQMGGTKSEVNYSNDFTKLTFLLRIKCPRFFSVTMILVDAYLYVRKVETGTSVRYNDLSCHSNRRNICNLKVRGGQVTFLA